MNKPQRVLPALMMVVGLSGVAAGTWAQEEDPPASFVSLSYGAACDDKNNRLILTNAHTFKTVVTTVKWRADGGKDLQDQFFPGPSATIEIGCAAQAEIVEASFAAF